MDNKLGSYLKHLPPVLYTTTSDNENLIGKFLLIFEKILTGVDDDVELKFNNQITSDFKSKIDNLYKLFNPWLTPTDFLEYLASWVALKIEPFWDEYQARKLVSEIRIIKKTEPRLIITKIVFEKSMFFK